MNTQTHIAKNPMRIGVAVVALLAAFTGGAYAQEAPQLHVKYADLNVNTTAGANVLYRRIRAAAQQVCGEPDRRDLAGAAQADACIARALAETVAKVDAPALTNVFARATGRTPVSRLAAAH